MKIDMWYGEKLEDCSRFDCFFNDLNCRYTGNFYKGDRAVGDFSAVSLQEVEAAWSKSHHPFTQELRKGKAEIERMLTISTIHIPKDLVKHLNAECQPGGDIVPELDDVSVYQKAECGWFIYFPDDVLQMVEKGESNLAKELIPLCKYTKACGCSWLCLDSDGAEVDWLPKYDW